MKKRPANQNRRKPLPPRRASDPRVVAVMSALDAQLASVVRSPTLAGLCFAILSDLPLLRNDRFAAWSDDALRAVLRAHLQHCPEAELDAAAQTARDESVWLEEHERVCLRAGFEAAIAEVN